MTIYKLRFVGNGEFIVISPQILQRLIGKVMESSKRELSVSIDSLFPKEYQEYVLNVLNSNGESPYFSFEYITSTPMSQRELFTIIGHQLGKMRVEEEKCFETVRLLEKKGMVLELNCSNNFWIVCKNSDDNAVQCVISSLRRKLRKYTDKEYIQTVWGVGYKFVDVSGE